MVKFLNWLIDKLMSRRKKPWARFEISGIQTDGEVRFDIAYNKAFIQNLQRQGLAGIDDDETVQNFLFGTLMYPKDLENEQLEINSMSHPNLSKETNVFRRG